MKRFFCWFAFFASIQQSLHAQSRLQDSLVLVDLYLSTNGNNWTNKTNWLTMRPMEQWYGVYFDTLLVQGQGRVKKITLHGNNLTGSLPSSLGNLTALEYLYISRNQFGGTTIPASLGKLTTLTYLGLSWNNLAGTIPDSLSNLTNLEGLSLGDNQLTGTIPASLGNLSNLIGLDLYNNQLTGSIPIRLSNLSNLVWLNLWSNKLSDTIPSSLGNLSNLRECNLFNNQLTGSIPSNLSSLQKLTALNLNNNLLSGRIPPSLSNLPLLALLGLSQNQLTDTIPASLGNLNKLESLLLDRNQLIGKIPNQLGNLVKLKWLYLYGNQLTGNIPDVLGNLSLLTKLYLSNNQLSGSIPFNLGNLSNLDGLALYDNQLNGNIPSNLGNLIKLQELLLYNNQLSGSIPTFNLPNLRTLNLRGNQFSGDFPSIVAPNLIGVYIDSNKFTFRNIIPTFMSLRLTVKDYHNQDFIFKDTTFYKSIGDSLTINLGIDSNLQSNVYKWFRNQALYKTIIGSNKLIFNDLRQSDTGIYTCKVTNTGAPLLTLTSRNIKLNVGCNFTQIEQQKYICENSFYTLSNGKKVNEAGTYRDTISCGTILILHLSIARKDTTRLSRITCNPNIIGIKDTLLKNRFECDSLVRTTFTYVPIVTRLRDSIVCLAKDTQTITRKELSFQGCDSTVIRTLRLQRDTILTNTFICDTVNQRIETTLVSNRDGCQSMVQTQYRFEPCECLKTTTIYNALISNDNDQKNDVFFIQNIENFQPNELIITDKRNEFIYRVSNYNNDWKGTNLQGISLPAGTYNYVFRMTQTACLRVGAVDLKYD